MAKIGCTARRCPGWFVERERSDDEKEARSQINSNPGGLEVVVNAWELHTGC